MLRRARARRNKQAQRELLDVLGIRAEMLLLAMPLIFALGASNIVGNGDFLQGSAPGEWITVRAGSAAIAGWRVVRGDVDYVGTYWQVPGGGRSVNLDGAAAGAIEQTLHTSPGTRYRLQFEVAPNPEGPPAVKHLRVTAGATSANFDIATPPGATRSPLPWTTHTVVFTATSSSTLLQFASLDAGRVLWNGPVIAAVRVVPAAGAATSEPAPTAAPATAPPATAQPATAAARTAPPAAQSTAQFAGTWLAAYPDRPVRLDLQQHGAHVVARVLDGRPTFFTGDTAFTFDARGMSLVGLARCPGAGGGWHGATVARTTPTQLVLTIADCARSTVQIDRAP